MDGGLPPLGYDLQDKKLVVNEAEAERVRDIYRRYVALGSVLALKEELDRDRIHSKSRVDRHGNSFGDKPLTRGALYLMVQNRLYRGEIVHKGVVYPGEHAAIIDAGLWEAVQSKLSDNRIARAIGSDAEAPSLLAGLIFDETGERMSPTHTNKKGKRYRYYISQALIKGRRTASPHGRRLPAAEVEALVQDRRGEFLKSEAEVFAAIESNIADHVEASRLVGQATGLSQAWRQFPPSEQRRILLTVLVRVDIRRECVEICANACGLVSILHGEVTSPARSHDGEPTEHTIRWTVPVRLRRTGIEKRLLIEGATDSKRRAPDHSLSRLIAQAHLFQGMLMRGNGKTLTQLAKDAGVTGSYFTRVLRLSFLAPEITRTILSDQHPIDLWATRLINDSRLPISWEAQRAHFGLG